MHSFNFLHVMSELKTMYKEKPGLFINIYIYIHTWDLFEYPMEESMILYRNTERDREI